MPRREVKWQASILRWNIILFYVGKKNHTQTSRIIFFLWEKSREDGEENEITIIQAIISFPAAYLRICILKLLKKKLIS